MEYPQIFIRNVIEITYPNSPSPFMERGLGGEVNEHIISDSFLDKPITLMEGSKILK